MKLRGNIVALVVLAMLMMPFCPMSTSAAGPSAASHNCHGEKQAPSGKGLRSCCDEVAIPVLAFQAPPDVPGDFLASVPQLAITTPVEHSVFTQESSPPDTGARLAQLSLLRI